MMRAVICKGDPTSHGGKVLEGNANVTTNGRQVAQRGHMTFCPKCKGNFPIAEGLDFHTYAGIGTAVDGMRTACGAKLMATQHTMQIDDAPAAAPAMAALAPAAAAGNYSVAFADSDNARANITYCSLLKDVLPRTHPAAFAALLSEAHKTGVTEVRVTSCWRPMLGSIAHRAGLGLDIVYIANASQTVRINRVGLTGAGGRNPNIGEREKQLYDEFMVAKQEAELNSGGMTQTRSEKKTAAKFQWDKERDKNEPVLMNALRNRLGKNTSVSQIFDPWYMESNTGDLHPQAANEQRNDNEKTHAHHLHITVKEPNIL